MHPDPVRRLVWEALVRESRGEEPGAFPESAVPGAPGDARDRAFYAHLLRGVFERRITLDYHLDRVAGFPMERQKPKLRALLRMGAYQILFMDRVPDRAAIDTSVELCRACGMEQMTGVVNGILRSVAREKNSVEYPSDSIRYSVPQWICDLWEETWGTEMCRALLAASLAKRPVIFRVDRGELFGERHRLFPYAVRLHDPGDIRALKGYAEGNWMVQDAGAMCVTEAAGIRKGDLVIDLCAAPGGKAIHAAAKGAREVICIDLHAQRAQRIRENAARMKADAVRIFVRDARKILPEYDGKADVVICDVPCSGLGVLARKPSIKYRLSQKDIDTLAALQREIASCAVRYLKPGGVLIYATCTLTREENLDNFRALLEDGRLEADDLTPYLPAQLAEEGTLRDGYVTLIPGKYDTDGFFIARCRKKDTDPRGMNREELARITAALSEKAFRADQLFSWMHEKGALSYDEMTDLPKTFRAGLAAGYPLALLKEERVQTSARDGTKKALFSLPDGEMIESVLMRYRFGLSACISSQAGCAMGCTFCASGLDGLFRNLTVSEMLGQVYALERIAKERVKRVVVMGSGEPFHNYAALIRCIRLLNDEKGHHIGSRHITVSTCGIAERIVSFAEDAPQCNLAISLHAAIQPKRERLMPVARAYPLPVLMEAVRAYAQKTRRQVTFEYALLHGINDLEEDTRALRTLLSGIDHVVNLIPVNPVTEKDYAAPDKTGVREFKKNLEKMGINVTIRREMGRDIDGACGQLRHREAMR